MTSRENSVGLMNKLESTEKSPARKRSRIDVTLNNENFQKWSVFNDSALDNMADIGVGRLANDSSDELDEDGYRDFLNLTLNSSLKSGAERDEQIAMVLQSTIHKETLEKISANEWEQLLKCKPKRDVFKINHFQQLSDEVILQIFYWLPKRSMINASLVCRRWYRLSQDDSLWSRMDVSDRHLEPGALGQILSRQVIILRLANSDICYPPILPGVKAFHEDFRSRLLYLDLSMAHISTDCLTILLSKCRRLKKLSLEHIEVNDDALFALSKNKELEILNLAMANGLEQKGLTYLLTNCRKLKELNIAWTYLNTASVEYVCSHLPSSIDRLNFSGCRKLLLDTNVRDLVSNCPNLRELDLSDSTGVSGRSIPYIVQLKELNFLALSRCYFISYRALLQLESIKSLMYLDVHGDHIDASELEAIQKSLGSNVKINKFKFSSVARPTVGPRRLSIWGLRVRD
ncbi:hypothetical protein FQR65_LT07197 [Abscondita terminalis]|nr:hypothetical protein FQR65_LT07197 [Abscondita terminalis]